MNLLGIIHSGSIPEEPISFKTTIKQQSSPLSLQLVHREGASSIPTAVVYTGWRPALQYLLSAHTAPLSTYPTHQTT